MTSNPIKDVLRLDIYRLESREELGLHTGPLNMTPDEVRHFAKKVNRKAAKKYHPDSANGSPHADNDKWIEYNSVASALMKASDDDIRGWQRETEIGFQRRKKRNCSGNNAYNDGIGQASKDEFDIYWVNGKNYYVPVGAVVEIPEGAFWRYMGKHRMIF